MSKLYELSNQIVEVSEMDDSEAVKNTLDGLEMEFKDKAEQIVLFERNIQSYIDSVDAEIERLKKIKTARQNKINRFKEYLRENMERSGIKKIECHLFTITLAKGRESVMIEDDSALPDDLVSVSVDTKPNKAEIKRRIKAGEEVPGAKLVTGDGAILIK